MEIIKDLRLSHYSSRQGHKITAAILHYPAPNLDHPGQEYSPQAVYESLDKHKFSYHYYVTKKGDIYQFVEDQHKAWHAGASSLHGMHDCNLFSLGIAMENNGGESYTDDLMESLADLLTQKYVWHKMFLNQIVGHCHVSPGRKYDPGKLFDWGLLEYLMIKNLKEKFK